MTAETKRIFMNEDEFYAERGGKLSGEQDYGVHWRSGNGLIGHPRYRISVVHDTGDVYAEATDGTIVLLTTLDHGCVMNGLFHGGGPAPCPYEIGERVFAGWAEVCGQPNSYEWFKARC